MSVVTHVGRDPHEARYCAGHVLRELRERDHVGWTAAAVVRERVVLDRVWIRAFETTTGLHSVHVGPPGNVRGGQLRAEAARGQRVISVVRDAPRAARSHGEVVGQAWVRDTAVVGRVPVLPGELGRVSAGESLGVRPVLHHDHEHVSRRRRRRGRCVRGRCGR